MPGPTPSGGSPTEAPSPPTGTPPGPTEAPGASSTPDGPVHLVPDLAKRPLIWFAPLPPQRGGPYDGSDDWSDLWTRGEDWRELAGMLDVYKLYGGWSFAESTPQEMDRLRRTLDGFGVGLSVETGPLLAPADCGADVEGFAGDQARDTVENVRQAGGTIDLIALDEPWYYAHHYDGPQACHWPLERIAEGVRDFIAVVRQSFPNVLVGDIEPTPPPVTPAGLGEWIDVWTQVVGEPPAFLHLDVNSGTTDWTSFVREVGEETRRRGVPYGVIAIGDPSAATDLEWLQSAGARLSHLRFGAGVEPDHIIFQSWHDLPDRALPDSDPTTYTGWLREYLTDPLSEAAVGPLNLALSAFAEATSELPGAEAARVNDGTPAHWNSADGVPQWVQLTLGEPAALKAVELTVAQDPPGASVHELWVRRVGGKLRQVHVFSGVTANDDLLVYEPTEEITDVEAVRVVTTELPGGLYPAWREIKLIGSR